MEDKSNPDRDFDKVLEESRKRAGFGRLLEHQAIYEEYIKKKDLIYRPWRKRTIITTTNSSGA